MPSATTKRSRRAAFDDNDDDDDGNVTIVQASSSLRNETQRKKARLSNVGPSRKSVPTPPDQSTSSDEENDVMQEVETPPTPPASTQYEIMRDGNFEHLKFADQDDHRATQRLKNRPNLIGDNHAAQNAIIESITCINFMCHQKLHVTFGPLLNFVVGENGSGKSAVLTAITLCLGGKASATNRGGSLRSFVKEGQEHAILIVKIKNQGDDAFKPEQFGESIIVERHFSKSGSSGFKLKSVTGRIISTKKGDVDDVVDYFCLQVDNPLNILSQDNARQFLNAATPAAKYKYFVMGTQLEQLDNDYQLLQEILDANETKLEEYQENITFLKDKSEKAVKLRDAVSKHAEMRQRSKVYTHQLAWAQVMEQEAILQAKDGAIIDAEQQITNMGGIIEEKSQILDNIDNEIQRAGENLTSIRQEEGEVTDKEKEAKANYESTKRELLTIHTQERDVHGNLDHASTNISDLQAKISAEEQRLEQREGGILAAKQKEQEEANQAVKAIEESIATHNSSLPALKREFVEAEENAQRSGEDVETKRREVAALENRVRMLSQSRGDRLAGYDRKMPQLLKSIENDGGFREKPIGPIGSYIQLTQPKWSGILEKILNPRLNAFVVTSKSDHDRLSGLARKTGVNCPIIIASARRLGNNLREPDEMFDTVMRVLRFDSPVVRDQLIINDRIEQVLLIEEREEAERVMYDHGPPANVASCLTFNDGNTRKGLRLVWRNANNQSTSPVDPDNNQKPRMKSDVETEIQYQQGSLEQLRTECRDMESARRVLQQAVQRCSQAVAQHKRHAQKLESDRRRAEATVSAILTELDQFEGSDGRLEGLKDALKQAQSQMDHYGNQYGELSVLKAEKNRDVERLKSEFSEMKAAARDFEAKIAKAEERVQRYNESRRVALVEKNAAHERLDMAKVEKENIKRSRDRQAQTVEEYSRQAASVCAERAYIPDGETVQSIERKFEAIKDQLRKARNRLGASDEEINNRAAQALEEFRDAKKSHKDLTSLVDGLKKALMDRLAKWRVFQRLISAHARSNFSYLLSERSYRGKLLLDHKAKKLEIQVEPDQTRRTTSGRNTKTLSGGEKSFSSICLLLAIWDAMGSPLRCLDEFDVFMDSVNRAISTNMLITAARRSVGKQFILITPNAIEGRASNDEDVKIIRLSDPRQRLLADH
ncbi:P-loop containing nucleoside triphosphate hydrolase protein [Xylariomycetidae sp. FL2044]|nr:P-loop containing nucleoside triphosphate hydrolase protein [Xylariomycetidae sp. FL2044]